MNYYEAAALAFGVRPFSTAEFAARTASLRPGKTLSELKVRGLAERLSRGRYRLLSPSERPDLRASENIRVRHVVREAPFPWAWSGPSAVTIWTGGRYHVALSPYISEYYIRVSATSEAAWREYLWANRVSTDPRRRIGTKAVLEPVPRLRRTVHGGEFVIPRAEVLALIRAHRGIYAEADRLVEEDARPARE